MAEHDDELEALRDADPLDPATVPSSDSPQARALLERITMTEPTDATATPSSHTRWIAAAAVLVVLLGVGGALLTTNDDDPGGDLAQATVTTGGGITPGGSMGSCVELYDLQTLTNREIAFDGTVTAVAGDEVTFTVNEWYRGGDTSEVTLAGASSLGGLTSAGDPVSLAPGARLLVAGDGGFAWSCGFTQPYDPDVAADWAEALSG